jgi:hypothetical protein
MRHAFRAQTQLVYPLSDANAAYLALGRLDRDHPAEPGPDQHRLAERDSSNDRHASVRHDDAAGHI